MKLKYNQDIVIIGESYNMKYCKHCGTEVSDEAIICKKCGHSFEKRPVKEELSGITSIIIGIIGGLLLMVILVFLVIKQGQCLVHHVYCL